MTDPIGEEAQARDYELGRAAVDGGLVSSRTLEDCLAEVAAARGAGRTCSIAAVLVARRLVDGETLGSLLRGLSAPKEGAGSASATRPECVQSDPAIAATRPTAGPPLPGAVGERSLIAGRYEITGALGEGGMAVVYRAIDRFLGREVAVKFLREEGGFEGTRKKRFEREAKVLARLAHPNLVGVHDFGFEGERPFLVMELVPGTPLDRHVASARPALFSRVAIVEKVARAVHHAHEKGVVHRDLKPSNILVTALGEPKVVDFGLARPDGEAEKITLSEARVGTPLYMAPEQIERSFGPITPRTDVFALGIILYELASGIRPFGGRSALQVYSKILREDPEPLRKIAPSIARDLESIAARALEKAPASRYGSALEFADDLARYLEGSPVRVRPVSTVTRAWRKGLRHRGLVLTAALSIAGTIGAGLWGLSQGEPRESDLRARAEVEAYGILERARTTLDRAALDLYDRDADFSDLAARVGASRAELERALELAPELAVGHYLIGRAFEFEGWSDRARAAYRQATVLDPSLGPARVHLGRLILVDAFLTMRRPYVATRERPGLAWALGTEGIEEAMLELAAACESGSLEDALLADTARAFLAASRGDSEEALRMSRQGIEVHRSRRGTEWLHWIEYLLSSAGPEARIAALERALAIAPNEPVYLLCRAAERIERKDDRAALDDLGRALAVRPRFLQALRNRAVARKRLGDFPGALADLDLAAEIAPEDAPALCNRALCLSARGEHREAIRCADLAVGLDPANGNCRYLRGYLFEQVGQEEQALAEYDRALALDPSIYEALANRGPLRAKRGDLRRAREDLEKALQLAPADWPKRSVLEQSLAILGERGG